MNKTKVKKYELSETIELESEVDEFLYESNAIESEYSRQAFEDAVLAWDYAFRNMSAITLRYVLEIHNLLAGRIRPAIAGKLRSCDVWVGSEHKSFTTQLALEDKIKMFIVDLNRYISTFADENVADFKDFQLEEAAKRFHIYFLKIYPFVDFSEEVGRILYNIHRLRMGLPLKIIREVDRLEYLKWFNQ